MKTRVASLLFVIVSQIGYLSGAPDSLRLVSVIFRHGDRTPITPIPSDYGNNESTWTEGLGQLTPEGVQQAYDLGHYLRQQYNGYISKTYRADEIYVLSSYYDRTIMTADAMLAGFYSLPEGDQLWKTGLPWYPIPVHSRAQEYDNMIVINGTQYNHCVNYNDSPERNPNSLPDTTDDKGKIEAIQNVAGLMNSGSIYDTLLIERLHNRTWPFWVSEELFQFLHNYSSRISSPNCNGKVSSKFTGGVLLNKMNVDMKLRQNGQLDEHRKMFVYSGHDSTVIAVSCAMQVWYPHWVPYTACLMVELHQSAEQHEYFVRIYYRNDTSLEREILTVPGCKADCPLDVFINITDVSVNGMQLCQSNDLWTTFINDMPLTFYSLLATSIAFLLFCISLVVCCHKRCKNHGGIASPRHIRAVSNQRQFGQLEHIPMIQPGSDGESDEMEDWNHT